MPTLSQQLGSLPTESMAEIFPRCRRDYPLPPPIKRGGFDRLEEEKIGSKISQKIGLFPVSATFSLFFCFSFSLHCCNHRQHTIIGLPTTSSTTETFLLDQQTFTSGRADTASLSSPSSPTSPRCRLSSSASSSFFLRRQRLFLQLRREQPAPPRVAKTTGQPPLRL